MALIAKSESVAEDATDFPSDHVKFNHHEKDFNFTSYIIVDVVMETGYSTQYQGWR